MSQKLDQIRSIKSRLQKQLDQLSNQVSIGNDATARLKAETKQLLEDVNELEKEEFSKVLANDPRNQMANELERVRKEYEGI